MVLSLTLSCTGGRCDRGFSQHDGPCNSSSRTVYRSVSCHLASLLCLSPRPPTAQIVPTAPPSPPGTHRPPWSCPYHASSSRSAQLAGDRQSDRMGDPIGPQVDTVKKDVATICICIYIDMPESKLRPTSAETETEGQSGRRASKRASERASEPLTDSDEDECASTPESGHPRCPLAS